MYWFGVAYDDLISIAVLVYRACKLLLKTLSLLLKPRSRHCICLCTIICSLQFCIATLSLI